MTSTTGAFTIRPERHADAVAIRRVVAGAFGSTAEADLVDAIRASPGYVPELALVAEADGEVVGHVMISGARLDGDDAVSWPIVMLSPLAVAPSHQGRGVGGALVRAVVGLADERGEPLVVLEGSPTYYARFGFEDARRHGIQLPLPDWAPAEAGQVRRLGRYDATWRGTVVYPPAFDGVD